MKFIFMNHHFICFVAIIIMVKISPSLFKPLTKIMLTQVRPPSADKEMKEMEVKSVSLTQISPREDVHCTLYIVQGDLIRKAEFSKFMILAFLKQSL